MLHIKKKTNFRKNYDTNRIIIIDNKVQIIKKYQEKHNKKIHEFFLFIILISKIIISLANTSSSATLLASFALLFVRSFVMRWEKTGAPF